MHATVTPAVDPEARSLLAELKRRRVFRAVVGYGLVAFALLQVIEPVMHGLHWPDAVLTWVVGGLALGFPVVVALAWVFDVNAGRIERTGPAAGWRGFRLAAVLCGIGVLAAVPGVAWYFVLRPGAPTSRGDDARSAAPDAAPPAGIQALSIAVLPLVDMSPGKDQEYFADGLAEELLNQLAKIPTLHVTSRSSAFSFKGKGISLPEIARRLKVAHILEGSVRKAGNRVRVTAQLIDARTDSHLWSEIYDRPMDDIFAVQDEIAAAVAAQLKITLLGAAPRARTTDPRAYALSLEGRQYARQFTREGFERSIALFQQALAIDPDYAAAWDGLAQNYINQVYNGLRPADEGYRMARDAANKAIAIEPDFAIAHARLGSIASRFDDDLPAAARHFERALALEPANSSIIGNAASLARQLGRLDTAIALQEYTNARDPLSGIGHQNLGIYYIEAGRLDDGIAELHTALDLSPKRLGAYDWICRALLLKGDPKAALAVIQQEPDEESRLAGLAMALDALGQKGNAAAALAELTRKGAAEPAAVAEVLAFRGDVDLAFPRLDQAASSGRLRGSDIVTNPNLGNLRRDPRWLPFLRKIGKAPEQLATIKFDVKVPAH